MKINYLKISILVFLLLLFVFLDIYLINNSNISYEASLENIKNNALMLDVLKHNYKVLRLDGLETIKIFLIFSVIMIAFIGVLSAFNQYLLQDQKSKNTYRDNQFIELSKNAASENELARINALISLPLLSRELISSKKLVNISSREKYLELLYTENPYIRETIDIINYTLCKESYAKLELYKMQCKSQNISETMIGELYIKINANPTLTEKACSNALSRLTQYTINKELIINGKNEWISAIDIKDKQLIGLYLENADMSGANLNSTNFMYSSLYNSNLCKADLQFSYLGATNLSLADLTNANLSQAYLTNSDLKESYLCHANLESANLTGANLKGANLCDANVINAIFTRANFYKIGILPGTLSLAKTLIDAYIDEDTYNNLNEEIKYKYDFTPLASINYHNLDIPEHFLLPLKESFLKDSLKLKFSGIDFETILKELEKMKSRDIFVEDVGILVSKGL